VNELDHPVPAPPAGEEIHLPGPSLLPFLCAIAITLVVVGTTISLVLSIVGLVLLVLIVIRWVLDTRRDIEELPEHHVH
jgi:Flp pilus assembly protein TadB